MPVCRHHFAAPLLIFTALFCTLTGCSQAPVKPDARAADAPSRIPALVGSANATDPASLEELVYALGDDDPAVRLFAIQALKDRTGQDLGYRYYDTPEARAQAQRRWRQWLADQQNPASPPPDASDATDPTTTAPTAAGDQPEQ